MSDKQQLAAMGEHLAEQQPLCMAKRIEELEAQVRVMAELLREGLNAGDPDYYYGSDLMGRIEAALAGKMPIQVTSEGWQLVPVNPTQERADAAKWIDGRLSVWKWADGYEAMLAAAPRLEPKP